MLLGRRQGDSLSHSQITSESFLSQLFLLPESFRGTPTFSEGHRPRMSEVLVCGLLSKACPGREITWGHPPDSPFVVMVLRESVCFRLWDP